jgi:hypothetical protein
MKFRSNAQKKRVDVWLIYRCIACDETWNLPIHERVAIDDITPDTFQAIARNDPALARRYAFDRERLAHHGLQVQESVAIAVRKVPRNGHQENAPLVEIALALSSPCRIRLDRLLSGELGISRSQLCTLHERGALRASHRAKPLRAPIVDGQLIAIDLGDGLVSPDLAAIIRHAAVAQPSSPKMEEGRGGGSER